MESRHSVMLGTGKVLARRDNDTRITDRDGHRRDADKNVTEDEPD
jgi:hypothetical protein